MKLLKFLLIMLLLGLPFGVAYMVYQAVDDRPHIGETRDLNATDIERAKDLVSMHDPRKLNAGETATLIVTQDDINLVTNYVLSRFAGGANTRVDLESEFIRIRATVLLPHNPIGNYLNLDMGFWDDDPLPQLSYLRVGRVTVPRWIMVQALRQGPALLNMDEALALAMESLHRVDADMQTLSVTYLWRPDLKDKLRAELVSQDDQERLQAYAHYLAEVTQMFGSVQKVSLSSVIGPVFQLASQRSEVNDPIAENQAAIIALASYVTGIGTGQLSGGAKAAAPRAKRVALTLHDRNDLPQHFLVSAALASGGGSVLSDAVGLFKEVDDSRGGTGFSFVDLAADRAGTRFGEMAVASSASAKTLQQMMANRLGESGFMPAIVGLPENMQESEFRARYVSTESAPYRRLAELIEQRVDGCMLFQQR